METLIVITISINISVTHGKIIFSGRADFIQAIPVRRILKIISQRYQKSLLSIRLNLSLTPVCGKENIRQITWIRHNQIQLCFCIITVYIVYEIQMNIRFFLNPICNVVILIGSSTGCWCINKHCQVQFFFQRKCYITDRFKCKWI